MSTATATLVEQLTAAFSDAKDAAIAAGDANREDDGTCNMDTPAFRIEGVRSSVIEAAAAAAEVRVDDFKWFGGRRWFWLFVPLMGQGNRRSRMSSAATKALKQHEDKIPGLRVCEYQQMD
jgi:hypothetical protein